MKKHILLLKIIVTGLFLWLLLFKIQWTDLGRVFRDVHPGYVLVSILLSFVLVATSCWKWWAILGMQGHRLPFLTLYRWYFIGYFYTNFLPSSIGGDLFRSWISGRKIGSQEASLVAIFAERFTGMVFLLLMVVVSPFLLPSLRGRLELAIPSVLAGVLLAGFAVVPFLARSGRQARLAARWAGWLRRMLRADRPGRAATLLDTLQRRIASFSSQAAKFFALLRANPRNFWTVAALTALFYAFTVANIVISCRAFAGDPDPLAVAAVLPAALLVASLPITLGSLGLAEGAYVFYFGEIGLPGAITLAMALLLRLKIIFLGLIGLVIQARERIHPPTSSHFDGASHP